MPTYTIFCGVNGIGKTTLYNKLKKDKARDFGERINLDEYIFENGGSWKSRRAYVLAGVDAFQKINRCLEQKTSFNQETTFLTPLTIKHLNIAKKNGFKINICFICAQDVEVCLARIENRVKNGGHGVSEEVVRHRFQLQYFNLDLALKIADSFEIYQNQNSLELIKKYDAGRLTFASDKNCVNFEFEKAGKNKINFREREFV